MTTFELAQRFIGAKELPGNADNPLIQWWLSLCGLEQAHDEVAWCSAFVNGVAWVLRLPRSKSAAARSWLGVGVAVALDDARVGDVVILKRGDGIQPGPEVIDAQGHVGFYAGRDSQSVLVLGGNQDNSVSVKAFRSTSVLGVRRLA